jgi:hypothetical protein
MKYQSALSLPLAAACLVFLTPNIAAARSVASSTASNTMNTSPAGRNEATRMVPAQANLTRPLNSRNSRVGQKFEARLNEKVHLKNGPVLPKGTELVGKVVKDQASSNGKSTLALRFTQADLKGGKTIPIKATIVGLYSNADQDASSYGVAEMPNNWTPKTLQVDQINALNHVDLHSKISASNSGVLQSDKSNIHFSSGTEFALAIAKRS